MLLFSLPVLGVISLFVSVIATSAQALSSGSTSSSNSTISESHVTQMGICVVGAGGQNETMVKNDNYEKNDFDC